MTPPRFHKTIGCGAWPLNSVSIESRDGDPRAVLKAHTKGTWAAVYLTREGLQALRDAADELLKGSYDR